MSEAEETHFVEALLDSGSAINLMTENTYLKNFSNYNLNKGRYNTNYRSVNKSPLNIYGYIMAKIRLKGLSNHVFVTRFAIVPDTTMTYDTTVLAIK